MTSFDDNRGDMMVAVLEQSEDAEANGSEFRAHYPSRPKHSLDSDDKDTAH